MATQDRDMQFDIARVLSILWVVVVWHVYDYNPTYKAFIANDYTYMMTRVMLGVLMFSSGYFMSKYSFNEWNDVKKFFIKRFWRLYPLYALAAVILFLLGFIVKKRILLTALTGLSPYITPQPSTLWFVAILISFYFVTPILYLIHSKAEKIPFKDDVKYLTFILCCFVLFSFLYWISRDLELFEVRLAVYFPIYFLGYVSKKCDTFDRLTKNRQSAVVMIVIASFYLCFAEGFNTVSTFGFIVVGVFGFLSFSELLSTLLRDNYISKAISVLAYASMCIYLFHRVWFTLADFLFDGKRYIPLWFIYLFVIPFTIIMGYYIQKKYDSLLK